MPKLQFMQQLNTKKSRFDESINPLLKILVEENYINLNSAIQINQFIDKTNNLITKYLVTENILTSREIVACLQKYMGIKYNDLNDIDVDLLKSNIISRELMLRYSIVPIKNNDEKVIIGMTNPTDVAAITALKFHTNKSIEIQIISEEKYRETTGKYLSGTKNTNQVRIDNQSDETIITLLNQILQNALENKISDIHIEPQKDKCHVRFRRDGILYLAAELQTHLADRITRRIKVLAEMNISEKRLPQDGRFKSPRHQDLDIRVSTCPILHGEKIVLRLLKSSDDQLDIDHLGMLTEQLSIFKKFLLQPQGLILVTGPTGSGKSRTLYSALKYINKPSLNIYSVEDPIEIELKGINQIPVKDNIDFGFSKILKNLLRQDPDIVMIGEIRDQETATIALEAAQTGHLVLSTLHTNSAAQACARLQQLNIPLSHLNNSTSLIISQRLLRKLCNYCKAINSIDATYTSRQCQHCHNGYLGRTAIFELLVSPRQKYKLNFKSSDIQSDNHPTLWDCALNKISLGITSLSEVERVLGQRINE